MLEATKLQVLAKAVGLDLMSPGADRILRKVAGQPFSNTSPLTMKAMLSDDKNVAARLRQYIAAFSPAATEVLDAYRYDETITRLDKAGGAVRGAGRVRRHRTAPEVRLERAG